ncbi:MAG: alpha-L-rhamnosidase N-terminal domain-containing protein [Ardenticatenaceae bacterium]|nr:alpha-L-rhamnosidase N-terminal domain-containing protein [Anaerolineales bacterium]MCB8937750.1 alpha-L-rhamnosidase N-terminal domain-containing protein [Ardenticatenaceae bacterium]MCB8974319.1 alpha-L-rhamnosidase N-terminal domain-containing protein [Ardenticatenaceae bacterium]
MAPWPQPDALQIQPPETAVWIAPPHPFDLHEVYLNFRSPRWQWDGGSKVILWITADSRYKLWVNGRFQNRGPARSWPHAQKMDVLDITDQLIVGENMLAVQVYQPGYSHFSAVHRAAAGLLAWVLVDDEVVLVTNGRWHAERDLSFASDVPRISIYGSGVERRDMNKVMAWETAVFDDSHWSPARVVAEANGSIWSGLQKRITPHLVERTPILALPLRRGGNWLPLPLRERAGVRVESWLFDLGRAHTCQGWAEVKNASGGEQLAITYAEKTAVGELVIADPTTYCRMRPTDFFTLRPGEQTIEPFNMRGGRFVLFQLIGADENVELTPHVRIAEYPLVVTKPLHMGDDLLDGIVALCDNTLHACLQDTFVDCVWRESSQWLGDALPQALGLSAMGDDLRPLQTILFDTAQGIYSDGILPSVAPAEVHAYTIPRYSAMWVELLALYWQQSGDAALVQQLWPTLKRVLAALLALQNEDGLLVHPPGLRFYIDWSATAQSDPHLVFNLHVVLALQIAAELANEFEPEMATIWQAAAGKLQEKCREGFWGNGRFHDDLAHTTHSQLGAAMALLTSTATPAEADVLLDAIIARSMNARDEHENEEMVLASPFMHHYIFEGLGKYGRIPAILDIIKLRWGRWVKQGYPTTWENWNVDFPDGSQCHAFSAHPRYHLAKIFNK